ncbi:MAG: tetratricopeptide repeat protein [Acidobacteriota bacterium]|nr:tetratricopeptide repeat protein [Acidobacteriota bacterium]
MRTLEAPYVRRFADVEIDVREGRVFREGSDQRLRQKVFQVLLYLIDHRDRPVSKEELMASVWSGTAVTDDAIVQCIVDLRRALGDDARNPFFIRTIPKLGYRFIAPEGGAPSPAIEVLQASESIEYEIVEDAPAAEPRNGKALVVPALAVSVALLSGVTWLTVRAAQNRPQTTGRAAINVPVDSRTSSTEAIRLYSMAMRNANAHRPAEAVVLLERALKLDPGYAMARARIGYVHGVLSGEVARGRPYIEAALAQKERLNGKDRELVLAWQSIVGSNYTEAIDRYRLIVERYPTDVEAHHRLATLLVGEEQVEEAVAILERARTIEPRSAEILNGLGNLNALLSRHAEAIEAHRKYVELDPNEANAWDSLGLSLQWAGRYDEAADAYARALELHPGFLLPRYHRASLYVQLGRFRDAAREVQECANRATTDLERGRAYHTLSHLHWMNGDDAAMRAADAQIPRGVGWDPLRAQLETNPSLLNEDSDEWEATRIFSGRGSRPDRRSVMYWRGYAAMRQGKSEEALTNFRHALRFRPLIWYVDSFETCLADAYLELDRNPEAAAEYRRVLAINPNHAHAIYGLARANEALGRRDDARRSYARFLTLWKTADPDARDLIEARKRGQ